MTPGCVAQEGVPLQKTVESPPTDPNLSRLQALTPSAATT
jgi:hypothetical protein